MIEALPQGTPIRDRREYKAVRAELEGLLERAGVQTEQAFTVGGEKPVYYRSWFDFGDGHWSYDGMLGMIAKIKRSFAMPVAGKWAR